MQKNSLFDRLNRDKRTPKRESEPSYKFLNESAKPMAEALRCLFGEWFGRYPDSGRKDLAARFRSNDETQHLGAFFELYLHELLLRLGMGPQIHPTLGNGGSTHPDFILTPDAPTQPILLEATVAGASAEEAAEEARISQVYDLLNKLHSPNFFLDIRSCGAPTSQPPVKGLKSALERWLGGLNPDRLLEAYKERGPEGLPVLEWNHEDWRLVFRPLPKSKDLRGKPGIRPIGAQMREPKFVASEVAIRNAVMRKATRYGKLDQPYMLAINCLDLSAEETDVFNALLGGECMDVVISAERETICNETRQPTGAFHGPEGPRNTRVSAVLVFLQLNPWSMHAAEPFLIHNPHAKRPLDPAPWPFAQFVPRGEYLVEKKRSRSVSELMSISPPTPQP